MEIDKDVVISDQVEATDQTVYLLQKKIMLQINELMNILMKVVSSQKASTFQKGEYLDFSMILINELMTICLKDGEH